MNSNTLPSHFPVSSTIGYSQLNLDMTEQVMMTETPNLQKISWLMIYWTHSCCMKITDHIV